MPIFVFPSLVRDQVMEQHAELRDLLEEVIAATAAPNQDKDRIEALARNLCERFRAHLAFEEQALKPVLAVLDSWGPERVRSLQDEHARQHRCLSGLLATFEMERDVEQLALALSALAVDLLKDMMEEEEGCLGTPEMAASLLTVERSGEGVERTRANLSRRHR